MNGTFPQFPFYDAVPHELFSQIKGAQYTFHNEVRVSEDTKGIVAKLLVVQPQARLTATELKAELEEVIMAWRAMIPPPPRDAQKVLHTTYYDIILTVTFSKRYRSCS